jgi:large subunit ribosomal protein L17
MKHRVKGKQLNRNVGTRRALFKNLTLALIEHGKINTTEAKAKAVRSSFEKLITKAKAGTVAKRRLIDEVVNRRSVTNKLVDEIAPAMKRTSGFTRIIKLGNRRGDDASMVRLEIIDWQAKVEVKTAKKSDKTENKSEEKAVTKPAIKSEEKMVSKVKRPTTASAQTKHIPQKRIAGGGK